jgi:hypothetical protein
MVFNQRLFSIVLRVLLLWVPLAVYGNDSENYGNDVTAPVPREIPMHELVDPTRPVAFVDALNRADEQERKLNLQAIYYGENRREAVINGRTVKVGSVVDQVRILAISPGRVRYIKNGTEGELVLFPQVLQPIQGED